jgi:hypothetical protein
MVTSSKQLFRPISPKNRPFFILFLHFYYALTCILTDFCVSIYDNEWVENIKNEKSGFCFTNIFFLKVKMDMKGMSFFKKKDRILTTFFPAYFHLTGFNILASNTLLSQKKSEIRMCPKRGYVSPSCACAHVIVSSNAD